MRTITTTPQSRCVTGSSRLRRALVAATLVAAVGASAIASQAGATSPTITVKGHFSSQIFSGAACASATGQCFEGRWSGSVKGPYEGAINAVAPTPQSDLVLGDAATTIHTKRGDLTCAHEQFVLNTSPASDGHFAWVCEITGGTGRYAQASGYMQGTGTTPVASGPSSGKYSGKITLQ